VPTRALNSFYNVEVTLCDLNCSGIWPTLAGVLYLEVESKTSNKRVMRLPISTDPLSKDPQFPHLQIVILSVRMTKKT
jgi:hypothetical protein